MLFLWSAFSSFLFLLYVFFLLMCNQNKSGKWLWHKQKLSTHHISIWPPLTSPRSLPTTLHPSPSVWTARQAELRPVLPCHSLQGRTRAEAARSLCHFSLCQIPTTFSGSRYPSLCISHTSFLKCLQRTIPPTSISRTLNQFKLFRKEIYSIYLFLI